MNYQITPITEHHIEGYAQALDRVARELRYLAYTAGPPLAVTVDFVRQNIAGGWPHFVALDGTEVVGWCAWLLCTGRSSTMPACWVSRWCPSTGARGWAAGCWKRPCRIPFSLWEKVARRAG
ncbi:hypothetical protein [Methylococcus sp. EFPC2]|uniref:hypothetical protein n=1 Tax=Methylococcus sp. EFPC2 TaxID=2812648 RepID=UPI001F074BAC|nr:hypothetical protein [Methylococcus sp. EFPC2]